MIKWVSVTFNVQTLRREERLVEICKALRSAHFIGLQSTSDRTKPEEDSPVYTTRADKFKNRPVERSRAWLVVHISDNESVISVTYLLFRRRSTLSLRSCKEHSKLAAAAARTKMWKATPKLHLFLLEVEKPIHLFYPISPKNLIFCIIPPTPFSPHPPPATFHVPLAHPKLLASARSTVSPPPPPPLPTESSKLSRSQGLAFAVCIRSNCPLQSGNELYLEFFNKVVKTYCSIVFARNVLIMSQ